MLAPLLYESYDSMLALYAIGTALQPRLGSCAPQTSLQWLWHLGADCVDDETPVRSYVHDLARGYRPDS